MKYFNNMLSFIRGANFENQVEELLKNLAGKFPGKVEVFSQINSDNSQRRYRADFELKYQMGGLQHHHLIECQDRGRSSQEIADKIYTIRGTSDRNRFIFVYKEEQFLSAALKNRLEQMGVLHFPFEEFQKFIAALELDLTLIEAGKKAMEQTKHPFIAEPILPFTIKNNIDFTNRKEIKLPSIDLDNYKPPSDKSMLNK